LRPLLSAEFARRTHAALGRHPALVHVHSSDYGGFWEKGLLAALAARAGIPVVLHLHGGSFDVFLRQLTPRRAAWARRIFARAARVVVLSEAWRPLVAEFVAAERIAVLPNAIDVDAFTPPPAPPRPGLARPVRLLFLGLLAARKGLDDLWPALQALGDLDWQLDVVGGEEFPGERRRAERAVAEHGIAARVRFHGPRDGDAKRALLHAADIFVLPSRSESFGIANLEAMAAGLAVVSTRTGAIPEYLQHGVHGLLVTPGDRAALTAALRHLIVSPESRLRLGQAALQRARDYDWTRVEAQVSRLYAEVLQGGR
jgi:glycosyltransferase involved in cell wall biosynthesis